MSLNIILAQVNTIVGDVSGNFIKIKTAILEAIQKQADLIVFPEMCICGYPPEDLLHRKHFHHEIQKIIHQIKKLSNDIDILIGYPEMARKNLFNAAIWFRQQKQIANYHKQKLPNYSVFDEERYFTAGEKPSVVKIKNINCGILICEDIWFSEPVRASKKAGAECIICINASPYSIHKSKTRLDIIEKRIDEFSLPICYLNSIGGQDELVFDGGSFVINEKKEICAQANYFEEVLLSITFSSQKYPLTQHAFIELSQQKNNNLVNKDALSPSMHHPNFTCDIHDKNQTNELENIYKALVLGTKDYVQKNGFSDVIIGLSGGVDSALTLAIAVDALGKDHVHALLMPSQYTRSMSLEDSESLTKNLNVDYHIISIQKIYEHYLETLKLFFQNKSFDTTEENIQARIRGMLLMAFSNKFGYMVLTTGNKSETAVGYVTLYGDMVGGFAPLKDVFKTLVYKLTYYRNTISSDIPLRIIERAPSAELAPNQKDEDSLPPYDILDTILELFIEKDWCAEEIIKKGFDANIVHKTIKMVLNNEYKRRQGPPGIRITEKAFGRDRRYPITSKYLK